MQISWHIIVAFIDIIPVIFNIISAPHFFELSLQKCPTLVGDSFKRNCNIGIAIEIFVWMIAL
jgi:hypothetical protein